jgi:P27 family predicted phage terminase small subunit
MPGGRPPKPTQLKILAGNPGKRPLNDAEPEFASENLTRPGWLDASAKREWARIVKAMPDGLATEGDRVALAAYCQAWARWQQAERALQQAGSLTFEEPVVSKAGDLLGYKIKARPEVAISLKYANLMLAAAGRFGLDPSSRSKIHMPQRQAEDPFGDFLKRSGQRGNAALQANNG